MVSRRAVIGVVAGLLLVAPACGSGEGGRQGHMPRTALAGGLIALLLGLASCGAPASAPPAEVPTATGGPTSSPTPTRSPEAPAQFVALSDVDPTILQDIRYAGNHNFVGRPIAGYREPLCILTRQAAEALTETRQQAELLRQQGSALFTEIARQAEAQRLQVADLVTQQRADAGEIVDVTEPAEAKKSWN